MENNNKDKNNSNLIFVKETDDFQVFEKKGTLLQVFTVIEDGVTSSVFKKFGKVGDEVFSKGSYEIDRELTPLKSSENSGFLNISFDLKKVVFKKIK